MTTFDLAVSLDSLHDLSPVLVPAQAAEILRSLGLTAMTECALKTRAYRKQVPFHRNGHRITFTISDLKEIAEGEAHRPEPRRATEPQPSPGSTRRRPHSRQHTTEGSASDAWRARRSL
jgi:hypothetical protein